MISLKKVLSKKRVKRIFTPDFFLSILLLGVSLRFSSDIATWFDVPQSDDNGYVYGGIHFLESLAIGQLRPDWSPLYQIWFYVIYRLHPDPIIIYYISMRLVGILTPLFAFLLLRRVKVERWIAVITAAFILASYALWVVEPRVNSFSTLILLLLWWGTSFFKERWQRLWGMAVSSFFLAYSRPEFFLVTVMLSVIAFLYLIFSVFRKGLKLGRSDFLFVIFTSGIALLFLIWWGVPFSDSRSMYAFGQHYAHNVKGCLTENTPLNMPWEEILERDFDNARGLGDAVRTNPLSFSRHVACNIQAFPKRFLKVAFSSAWGSSWWLIRIWVAVIFYRLVVHWSKIKHRFLWLWGQDFFLLGFFSLGVLLLDIFLIYPREHYLGIFSIILWVLGISLFGGISAQEQRNWRDSFVIGFSLLLLMPSLGALFDFEIPQKPVRKTVETLRALELDEPMRLFATRPFQTSRSEAYFEEDYIPIRYKPADVPFNEYISINQPNVIVITEGGRELQDDLSWLAFESRPQDFGYYKIPFDEGDKWGLWCIFLQD